MAKSSSIGSLFNILASWSNTGWQDAAAGRTSGGSSTPSTPPPPPPPTASTSSGWSNTGWQDAAAGRISPGQSSAPVVTYGGTGGTYTDPKTGAPISREQAIVTSLM